MWSQWFSIVHQDVIHEGSADDVQVFSKGVIDKVLEGCCGIGKTRRQNLVVVVT